MKMGANEDDKMYEDLMDINKLRSVLIDYLDDYNMSSSKEMKLVFFLDAIRHVARIARMVRQPRGNALLVGVGGTGKQSLTRLACHMSNYRCFQIELTRGYDYSAFRDDLKKLYTYLKHLKVRTSSKHKIHRIRRLVSDRGGAGQPIQRAQIDFQQGVQKERDPASFH